MIKNFKASEEEMAKFNSPTIIEDYDHLKGFHRDLSESILKEHFDKRGYTTSTKNINFTTDRMVVDRDTRKVSSEKYFKKSSMVTLSKDGKPDVISLVSNFIGTIFSVDDYLAIVGGIAHVTIFHHTDMDGEGSAALLYQMLLSKRTAEECHNIHFCKYNYKGNAISDTCSNVVKYTKPEVKKIAMIVDLSLTVEDMKTILSSFDSVLWIDHHDTSFQRLNDIWEEFYDNNLGNDISIILDRRVSAAMIVYSLFAAIINNGNCKLGMEQTMPALISIYDTKADVKFPDIYKYALFLNQYYNDMGNMAPDSNTWVDLFNNKYHVLFDAISAGNELFDIYMKKIETLYNNECHYIVSSTNTKPITVFGLTGYGNSFRFSPAPNSEDNINMLVHFNGNNFTASCYTDNKDIQNRMPLGEVLSKYFGGGGHPGAAGFNMKYSEFVRDINSIFDREGIDLSTMNVSTNSLHREETRIADMRYDYRIDKIVQSVGAIFIHLWSNINDKEIKE